MAQRSQELLNHNNCQSVWQAFPKPILIVVRASCSLLTSCSLLQRFQTQCDTPFPRVEKHSLLVGERLKHDQSTPNGIRGNLKCCIKQSDIPLEPQTKPQDDYKREVHLHIDHKGESAINYPPPLIPSPTPTATFPVLAESKNSGK